MDVQNKLSKSTKININHIVPIKEGAEAWRVRVDFVSDSPEKNKLVKEYYFWVTGEYLEDKANLPATMESAKKFALNIAQQRFEESGSTVPVENGISCDNKTGEEFVNPKQYYHPLEKP